MASLDCRMGGCSASDSQMGLAGEVWFAKLDGSARGFGGARFRFLVAWRGKHLLLIDLLLAVLFVQHVVSLRVRLFFVLLRVCRLFAHPTRDGLAFWIGCHS